MADFRSDKHFCFFSSKEMIWFCNELRKRFALPKIEQEMKRGQTETGKLETADLSIQILHTLNPAGLSPLDPKLYPKGCNYAVRVRVKTEAPAKWDQAWLDEKWIPRWIDTLGEMADGPLYLDRKRIEEEKGQGGLLGKLFGG